MAEPLAGDGAVLRLPELGIEIPLAEFYADVPLATEPRWRRAEFLVQALTRVAIHRTCLLQTSAGAGGISQCSPHDARRRKTGSTPGFPLGRNN